MDNLSEKSLYFKSIYIELKKVNYDKINNQPKIDEQIKVVTKDSYQITELSLSGFTLNYQRSVELDPKVLFDIKVTYEIHYEFTDDLVKEYTDKFDELSELVNFKAEKAINMTGVVSRASTLISCITMQNNGNAIITQPNFSKSK
jgi:hypothetical protein